MRVDAPTRNGAHPAGPSLIVDDEGADPTCGEDEDTDERGRRPGSTGLGLDIVARTADASGGSLAVGASPTGGFRALVTFGTPPAD